MANAPPDGAPRTPIGEQPDAADAAALSAELGRLQAVHATILEHTSSGIAYTRGRVIVWVNRAMAESFAYPSPDAMVDLPTRRLYATDEAYTALGARAYPVLARGEPFQEEVEVVRADGARRWMRIAGRAIDASDAVAGSIWTFEDVTERRAAADLFERQRRSLEELNASLEARVAKAVEEVRERDRLLVVQGRQAAMGEMIANIAHQWRQPLNALALVIANVADAQAMGALDEATLDRAVADANRLIQRMSATITDFRNFFRPDKVKRPFSMLEQVEAAIELVGASFRGRQITIEIEAPVDAMLWGYPNEYAQVVLDLLVNAKDAIIATGAAAGHVHVDVSVVDGEGWLWVRDTGGGIPEDVLDKVFQPYFSTKPNGTGIGLYMSKTIIEKNMGGRLSARNVPGGAELEVVVPCVEPPGGATP
jgi:PAS domain S-box-containing protein